MPSRQTSPRNRYDPRDPRARPRGDGRPGAGADGGGRAVGPTRRSPDAARLALLPLRFFLGGMLLYAGLDKLVDPAFLHATGPGSIGQQLGVFTHASPLTPLIEVFALPVPVLVGVLIAIAEIAVGLGALTGLLYRVSAVGGLVLSALFWLTASWTTRPFYYGPDLPYAFGWLTLALAGSGDLYTLRSRFESLTGTQAVPSAGFAPVSERRRAFLQAALLGAATVAVGGVTGVLGRYLRGGEAVGMDAQATTGGAGGAPSPSPSAASTAALAAGSSAAPASLGAGQGAGASGTAIATLSQLSKGHAYRFADPNTGDPAVLIRLSNDQVVAYDAVCTHQGCTVGYDSASGLLYCPCHGAVFDPTQAAAVLAGPTNTPLTSLPLHIDPATGKITLQA